MVGEHFLKYVEAFMPFLHAALRNFAAYQVSGEAPVVSGVPADCPAPQVCVVAVGLIGDLCRSLGGKMQPYCNDIMQLLVENLRVGGAWV